jgi:DNA-binding MarR family transcriptional regulator
VPVPGKYEAAQRSILALAQFGEVAGRAISDAVGPELRGNAEVITLFYLDLEGPARPGTLQELTGYTSGGTSRLLERLEDAGLLERQFGVVKDDRRAVIVQLTRKGRDVSRRMAAEVARTIDEQRVVLKAVVDQIGL